MADQDLDLNNPRQVNIICVAHGTLWNKESRDVARHDDQKVYEPGIVVPLGQF